MSDPQQKNPLHGVTLKAILEALVERYGWKEMASRIRINCFSQNPSIKSSLSFLRKTPWARDKVEQLYLSSIGANLSLGTKPKLALEIEPKPKAQAPQSTAASSELNVWTGKPKVNVWTGKSFEEE